MYQLHLDDGVTRLVQEVEDLCKGSDNAPKQLLYEGVSVAGTGCASRGDSYDALGGPTLVILYRVSTTPKTAAYGKSVEVARTDNTRCTRAPISLVMTVVGGIKSQLCHITVISYCNNIYIVFGDHFLLFWYKGLQ